MDFQRSPAGATVVSVELSSTALSTGVEGAETTGLAATAAGMEQLELVLRSHSCFILTELQFVRSFYKKILSNLIGQIEAIKSLIINS